MKIKKAKKLASILMNEAACKKRYGEEIANALLRLIGKLTEIVAQFNFYVYFMAQKYDNYTEITKDTQSLTKKKIRITH